MQIESILPYLILGTVSGLLSGLFGIGGGVVIVPILLILYTAIGVDQAVMMQLAVGSSLAVISITAVSSVRAHARYGNVEWGAMGRLAPGIVAGALLGAVVAAQLSFAAFRIGFAIFLLLLAVQIILQFKPKKTAPMPGLPGMFGVGAAIGVLSSLVGIGGGAMTVPFLARCGLEMRRAVGTAAACGLPIAIAGMVGFLLTGWGRAELPAWSTGFIYWPAVFWVGLAGFVIAPLGAKLAQTLPQKVLRMLFAAFLVFVAVNMLWR